MNRALVLLLAASLAGLAGTSAIAKSTNAGSVPESRLVDRFSAFAGSTANAQSLVEGLRTGTTITLVDASNVATSFSPPTKPMGWGNVKIALALAQAELAGAGITDPTPADIEAALNGGTVSNGTTSTTFTGVLAQRASGMGWGQIAHADNLNLGKVVSGASKPANAGSAQASASSASGGKGVASANSKMSTAATVRGKTGKVPTGVVTAAGASPQAAAANDSDNAMGGKGVVTAAGPATQIAAGNGHASAGLSTAANGEAAAGGVTSAAGAASNGNANHGHGKGHSGG
jgi:hypothetical protein